MEETYSNVGSWNLTDFHILVGAAHSPGLDPLMEAYRLAAKAADDARDAVRADEARVRRLPKPWLSDAEHDRLKENALRQRNAANRAKAAALDYLLSHPELLILQRRLG